MARKPRIGEDLCLDPTKPVGIFEGPGALIPAGFNGNKYEGLRYMPTPECGCDLPGNAYGMRRAEWIAWTKQKGNRVDPVGPMAERLKAAGLYEFALTEPTGE